MADDIVIVSQQNWIRPTVQRPDYDMTCLAIICIGATLALALVVYPCVRTQRNPAMRALLEVHPRNIATDILFVCVQS